MTESEYDSRNGISFQTVTIQIKIQIKIQINYTNENEGVKIPGIKSGSGNEYGDQNPKIMNMMNEMNMMKKRKLL